MLARSVLVLVLGLTGCIDYLEPGEVGAVRYFGEVRSTPGEPLPLLPPISDRDGNYYVLSGARDLRQVTVFTGQAGGGWSSGCGLHKGDDRGTRRTIIGTVTSSKMDKTAVVTVIRRVRDRRFHKFVTRRVKYKAHDEKNACEVGDIVEIIEARPFSRTKRWRVLRTLKKTEEVAS